MEFLPINIRISDAKILIVGGGNVATHKAQILSRFTNNVTVLAPSISDEIKRLPFRKIEKEFSETDLDGVNILYVCTGNHILNRRIRQMSKSRNILTSVCDAPMLCDFTSPAIYIDGNVTVSVASDAKDVKRSIRIRNNIRKAVADNNLRIQ
ncbi:MAG: bifunctional precorrin-2 dehydrogenase/sirohydrochlorin ferrochelatase [Bacteroidales bacterium]|nr:bifunctional precorrin-2 dehydrogenase/sirohydrochlorin ferrochelatase [Bacteroidales bacterium]